MNRFDPTIGSDAKSGVLARLLVTCAMAPMLWACVVTERAAPIVAAPEPNWYEYSAKFVCGTVEATSSERGPLNAGRYFTTVNVHNPSLERKVDIWYKAVASYRPPELRPPTAFRRVALEPDVSAQIDCELIRAMLKLPGPAFVEGWVVLVTRVELDVAPVYTAGSTATVYPVQSIDVERVKPVRILSPGPIIEGEAKQTAARCSGGEGCCCNIYGRAAGRYFGPCDPGLQCRGWVGTEAGRVATCTPAAVAPSAFAQLFSTEPPFCGNP